jgi:hypothetical protein
MSLPVAVSRYGAVVVARTSAVRDSLAVYGYLSQRLSASLLGRHQDPRHRRALRRACPQGWDPAVGRRLPTRQQRRQRPQERGWEDLHVGAARWQHRQGRCPEPQERKGRRRAGADGRGRAALLIRKLIVADSAGWKTAGGRICRRQRAARCVAGVTRRAQRPYACRRSVAISGRNKVGARITCTARTTPAAHVGGRPSLWPDQTAGWTIATLAIGQPAVLIELARAAAGEHLQAVQRAVPLVGVTGEWASAGVLPE